MYVDSEKLYCYLPGRYLQVLLEDARVLDKLMEELHVPGKTMAQLKRLPPEEKRSAIERQINNLRYEKNSIWYEVDAPEIIAATIWRSAGVKLVAEIFNYVKAEKALLSPVAFWLRDERQFSVFTEVPMGAKQIDVLGYSKGTLWGHNVTGVELKNDLEQFKRGLDQMTTFGQYAEEIYLACTPYMAAEYLSKHADARGVHHWDPDILNKKLRDFGFGLLLVRASWETPVVKEVLRPRRKSIDDKKLRELLAQIGHK